MTARTYELTIAGEPSVALAAAFDDFEVVARKGRTVLRIQLADQAALHGAIARLQALGLDLLEVNSVAAPGGRPLDGEGRGQDGVRT